MDKRTARWAHIVFWDREDLEKLHRLEVWLEERVGPAGETRRQVKGLGETRERALFQEMQRNHQLIPFWPPRMPLGAQENAMRDFEREIFPIWASIKARNDQRDKAAADSKDFVREIETLHTQDIAIFDSGKRPNRTHREPERAQ